MPDWNLNLSTPVEKTKIKMGGIGRRQIAMVVARELSN
jgi:hypothetical protein